LRPAPPLIAREDPECNVVTDRRPRRNDGTTQWRSTINLGKLRKQTAQILGGASIIAAAKVTPSGAVTEIITGAAGAVAAAAVDPSLATAGLIAGSQAGAENTEADRAERTEAGTDLGAQTQVLLTVTPDQVVILKRSALGKPSAVLATINREDISHTALGTTKLLGQTMSEIQITLTAGATIGFGVARVHRADGESVVTALTT